MSKFTIRLNIAGKSYYLDIERDKEELVRLAEKEVRQQFSSIESAYEADNESYLAMAALQIALQLVELRASQSLGDDLDALAELERKLDSHLNKMD